MKSGHLPDVKSKTEHANIFSVSGILFCHDALNLLDPWFIAPRKVQQWQPQGHEQEPTQGCAASGQDQTFP